MESTPRELRLQPGRSLVLPLQPGTELFCAAGAVQLDEPGSCLAADPARTLVTGQGWRAAHACRVLVHALSPARLRVCPVPVRQEKPRDAVLALRAWLRRLAAVRPPTRPRGSGS